MAHHTYITRQRGNCEERVNEKGGYVASRIYRYEGLYEGKPTVWFMPYYVSTGDEYFYKSEGGVGLPIIEEARAVLSTY